MRKRDWDSYLEEAARAFQLEMYDYLAKVTIAGRNEGESHGSMVLDIAYPGF